MKIGEVKATITTETKKPPEKKTRKKRIEIDVEKIVDEVFDQVDFMFSMTRDLNLDHGFAREIVKELVEKITAGYTSKPSSESILKKIKRYYNVFSEYIASKIIEEVNTLTPSQLEFVVMKGGKAVVSDINRLYNQALRYDRRDLIDTLRYNWNTHGPRGMVSCPRCGFNAISPEKTCIVCGEVVVEDYIRRELGFREKFELYVKTASLAELNETLQFGYVLLGERGVYPPRSRRARLENSVLYPIYLKRSDISRIIEEADSRDIPA